MHSSDVDGFLDSGEAVEDDGVVADRDDVEGSDGGGAGGAGGAAGAAGAEEERVLG